MSGGQVLLVPALEGGCAAQRADLHIWFWMTAAWTALSKRNVSRARLISIPIKLEPTSRLLLQSNQTTSGFQWGNEENTVMIRALLFGRGDANKIDALLGAIALISWLRMPVFIRGFMRIFGKLCSLEGATVSCLLLVPRSLGSLHVD
jgi:hypothetical protein